jgi:hypothetical protein
METTEKKTQKLEKLACTYLRTLKPAKQKKGKYTASFTVKNYKHLMFIISDLLKLCVNTIELEFDYDCLPVVDEKTDVAQILEIVIELLPHEEAEFLDEAKKMFFKENDNNHTPEKENS